MAGTRLSAYGRFLLPNPPWRTQVRHQHQNEAAEGALMATGLIQMLFLKIADPYKPSLVRRLQSKTHRRGVVLHAVPASVSLRDLRSWLFVELSMDGTAAYFEPRITAGNCYAAEDEIDPDSISRRIVRRAADNSSRLTWLLRNCTRTWKASSCAR